MPNEDFDNLAIGDMAWVRHRNGKYYYAVVRKIDKAGIKFHFIGCSDNAERTIARNNLKSNVEQISKQRGFDQNLATKLKNWVARNRRSPLPIVRYWQRGNTDIPHVKEESATVQFINGDGVELEIKRLRIEETILWHELIHRLPLSAIEQISSPYVRKNSNGNLTFLPVTMLSKFAAANSYFEYWDTQGQWHVERTTHGNQIHFMDAKDEKEDLDEQPITPVTEKPWLADYDCLFEELAQADDGRDFSAWMKTTPNWLFLLLQAHQSNALTLLPRLWWKFLKKFPQAFTGMLMIDLRLVAITAAERESVGSLQPELQVLLNTSLELYLVVQDLLQSHFEYEMSLVTFLIQHQMVAAETWVVLLDAALQNIIDRKAINTEVKVQIQALLNSKIGDKSLWHFLLTKPFVPAATRLLSVITMIHRTIPLASTLKNINLMLAAGFEKYNFEANRLLQGINSVNDLLDHPYLSQPVWADFILLPFLAAKDREISEMPIDARIEFFRKVSEKYQLDEQEVFLDYLPFLTVMQEVPNLSPELMLRLMQRDFPQACDRAVDSNEAEQIISALKAWFSSNLDNDNNNADTIAKIWEVFSAQDSLVEKAECQSIIECLKVFPEGFDTSAMRKKLLLRAARLNRVTYDADELQQGQEQKVDELSPELLQVIALSSPAEVAGDFCALIVDEQFLLDYVGLFEHWVSVYPEQDRVACARNVYSLIADNNGLLEPKFIRVVLNFITFLILEQFRQDPNAMVQFLDTDKSILQQKVVLFQLVSLLLNNQHACSNQQIKEVFAQCWGAAFSEKFKEDDSLLTEDDRQQAVKLFKLMAPSKRQVAGEQLLTNRFYTLAFNDKYIKEEQRLLLQQLDAYHGSYAYASAEFNLVFLPERQALAYFLNADRQNKPKWHRSLSSVFTQTQSRLAEKRAHFASYLNVLYQHATGAKFDKSKLLSDLQEQQSAAAKLSSTNYKFLAQSFISEMIEAINQLSEGGEQIWLCHHLHTFCGEFENSCCSDKQDFAYSQLTELRKTINHTIPAPGFKALKEAKPNDGLMPAPSAPPLSNGQGQSHSYP